MDIFTASGTLIETIQFGEGMSCSGGGTADFNSPNDLDTSISSVSEFDFLGTTYISDMNVSSGTGTWTDNGPGYNLTSGALSGTVVISEQDGTCTPGDVVCTVDASGITTSGPLTTAGTLPDGLSIADSAELDSPARVGLLETQAGCSFPFSLMDGGDVTITDLVLAIDSVT